MGPKRPRLMLNGEKEEDSHLGSRIRLTFSFKTTHTRPTNALNEKSETFSSKVVVPEFLFAGLTGQDAWQVGICMHMHMGLEIPPGLQIRGSKFRSSSSKFRELELQNFTARSRLYRSHILQVNTCWKAFAEIYTLHSFAPF